MRQKASLLNDSLRTGCSEDFSCNTVLLDIFYSMYCVMHGLRMCYYRLFQMSRLLFVHSICMKLREFIYYSAVAVKFFGMLQIIVS